MKDFFISYNGADRAWAEWIAWILEAAGYTVVIQAWDFRPGGDFVLDMQQAAVGTERTIAVLSDNYLNARYTQPEWSAALARDPQGQEQLLLPIRVSPCQPTGLLRQRVYVDLVGLAESAARDAILNALKERGKPARPPEFPGVSERVAFPGAGVQKPSPVKPVLSRAQKIKAQQLGKKLEVLEVDYTAVSEKWSREGNPQEKNNLKRQLEQIEQEMEQIEQELKAVGQHDV